MSQWSMSQWRTWLMTTAAHGRPAAVACAPARTILAIALLAFGVLATDAPMRAAATPPALVNYQGVLRDSGGNPLTGSYDMAFRFFNVAVGGFEILVDSHVGAQRVPVMGGLFNVALGGGVVTDGSGPFLNDPYLSLDMMFADFDGVWMEMEIDG